MTPTPDDIPRRPRSLSARSLQDLTPGEWSVSAVRVALRQHMEGDFSRSALLVDSLRGDDRIGGDLRTRVMAVSGLPFRIDPSPSGDQRRAKMVAAELAGVWSRICPPSTARALLRWAIMLQVAVGTCAWTSDGRRWTPDLKVWHPQHARFDSYRESMQVQTTEGLADITPGDGTWVLYQPEGDRSWMEGAVRGLAVPYLMRTYARRDWNRWGEKHGLPITGAVVPENADKADKDGFFADLRKLGSEGIVLLPRNEKGEGFDLEMIEPKNVEAFKGFERALYHCDVSAAVALLGQASNAQEGGSFAKANVLDLIRQDLLEADAQSLAQLIRDQVLKPWAAFNFGDADLAPVPVWDATPPADAKRNAETTKTAGEALDLWMTAAAKAGFEVDFETFARAAGVPVKRVPKPAPVVPPTPTADEN